MWSRVVYVGKCSDLVVLRSCGKVDVVQLKGDKVKARNGDTVPTSRVIKSRSFVITHARPKVDRVSQGKRASDLKRSYDVVRYLDWLDSE